MRQLLETQNALSFYDLGSWCHDAQQVENARVCIVDVLYNTLFEMRRFVFRAAAAGPE